MQFVELKNLIDATSHSLTEESHFLDLIYSNITEFICVVRAEDFKLNYFCPKFKKLLNGLVSTGQVPFVSGNYLDLSSLCKSAILNADLKVQSLQWTLKDLSSSLEIAGIKMKCSKSLYYHHPMHGLLWVLMYQPQLIEEDNLTNSDPLNSNDNELLDLKIISAEINSKLKIDIEELNLVIQKNKNYNYQDQILNRKIDQIEASNPPHFILSPRELEVIKYVGAGWGVTQISEKMGLSTKTISTYKQRALEKMKLENNADVIKYIILHKLNIP